MLFIIFCVLLALVGGVAAVVAAASDKGDKGGRSPLQLLHWACSSQFLSGTASLSSTPDTVRLWCISVKFKNVLCRKGFTLSTRS